MLWLALHLPRLPLEVFLRGIDTPDPAVVSTGGSQPRIMIAAPEALRRGVHPGMKLSAAHALVPELHVLARNLPLESGTLESLALWAEQFTPTLSIVPPTADRYPSESRSVTATSSTGALLLEIGGCLKLFGGLEALATRVREGLATLGFDTTLACAPTPAGALMLARNGLEAFVTDHDTLAARLRRLPVEAVAADARTMEALSRLGLRTLGEVMQLPRAGLARRFGQALLDRLDRAFGRLPDPRTPFVPPPRFASRLVLPTPVHEAERLLFGLNRLVTELTGFLAGRHAGVTRMRLELEHDDHPPTRMRVALSMPNRDPAHLLMLVREHLGRTTLPRPVEAFSLHGEETMQLAPRAFSFFATRETATEDRIALVERLRARLGAGAVHGLALVPEHRPELAFAEAEPGTPQPVAPPTVRPLWLLRIPRPLLLDDHGPRLDGRLRLLGGPERIESGWWDGNDVRRDYFVAENPEGARFWIYRERGPAQGGARSESWFLHGVFA
jgi:protein ImuB